MSEATPSGSPGLAVRGFAPDGSVLPFPGNAVLCRIGSGNPGFGTIGSIQGALRQERFARKFVFVPPRSLHMSVLDGAKSELRTAGVWPADMGEATLAEVNARFVDLLRAIDAPPGYGMRPTGVTLDPQTGSVIRLAPGSHADARRLRLLRERLAALLKLPMAPDYTPQIVLSYVAGGLDAEEEKALAQTHATLTVHLSRALSTLDVGAPEFCTHENLLAFERVAYLGTHAR